MLTYVTKKDKRRKNFDQKHIYDAIRAAFKDSKEKYTDEQLDELVGKVVDTISANGAKSVHVNKIQDTIENTLMDWGFKDTARAFIEFRHDRDRDRTNESEIIKTIKEITESELKSSNILRDNANESGATPAGTYSKIASETNKMYNLLNNVSRKYAKEHKDGYLHIHDLNMYNLTFNCLFAPVGKLLKSGFDSGTGFQRPAGSIQSAAALTAVILQLQSNQQYGGIACDNFDFDLAPFVDVSFRKNLARELNRFANYTGDPKMAEWAGDFKQVKKELVKKLQGISMNQPEGYLCDMFPCACVKDALSATDDDTHQAMEALVHNLNSLQSRSGNQVPFSSLNFGLDTSNCGRMVSKNIMRAQYEGMGDGLTAIFPILIFKLMKGYTKNEGDPNYDLYLQAIDCLARRFYPNFVSVDATYKKPYVRYDVHSVEFADGTELTFKKRGTNETKVLKSVEPTEYTVWEYELTPYDFWEVTEYKGGRLSLRKLIQNTTTSTMGCRTSLMSNVNGPEQTTGRGNFAFHTINLPRLAIESHIAESDIEKRKKLFFEKLDGMLDDAKGSLLERFKLICGKTYEKFPFTMQQGLYLTADDEPHKLTDKIGEVLKQSTLSIGYVGIAETIKLLTGKTFGIDHEIDEFAISIVKHIREFTDACQKETHLNWSTFATPAEAVAGRFATIDKNKFATETIDDAGNTVLSAKDKRLADVDLFRLFGKGYYTNSHMMDFSIDTSLENKIKVEAPFHELTNAGHIFYYKLNGDLTKNTAAVKAAIDVMYEGNLGYFTCTMDSDDCLECGFHGIINNECPKCGCKDENKFVRVRRITGYLTGSPRKTLYSSWGNGKLAELKDRHNI